MDESGEVSNLTAGMWGLDWVFVSGVAEHCLSGTYEYGTIQSAGDDD